MSAQALKRAGASPAAEGCFFKMEKINKYYQMGGERAHILRDVDLSLEAGEYLSVLGPSGSGKST
ncbi:MAG: ABC transporter ATP-binding protein, partial [Oscillospiraceae bacterium]|nr:ABC transporter ATP-binding protein [Oscillospiraceae bacterium]